MIPSLRKRNKRRLIRTSLVVGNVALLVVVGVFVLSHRSASQTVRRNSVGTATQTINSTIQNPLDQLSSAEIAAQAAQLAGLPEAIAVRNQADTENAQLAVIPSDSTIVAKPQIVSTALRSKKNIQKVKVAAGETVSQLAAKYGVTSDSIKWSNGLTGDTVQAGSDIFVPPGNGIVVQVKQGDTIDSLVNKYRADRNLFVTVNDAENGSLKVGEHIWVPNGQQPVVATARFTGYSGFAWGGYSAVFGGNGYDYGYCTWYVANKRAAIGRPIPSNLGNAVTWYSLAQRAGLPTGSTPQPGAVAWQRLGGYGHVAYVESVHADGSFTISEMNLVGWARTSSQTLPASAAGANYLFIY